MTRPKPKYAVEMVLVRYIWTGRSVKTLREVKRVNLAGGITTKRFGARLLNDWSKRCK